MAGVRVYIQGTQIRRHLLEKTAPEARSIVSWGISGGGRDAAKEIQARGRQDIATAGNFGIRWIYGFRADARPATGALLNSRIQIGHGLWFAFIHEFGGLVRGKPLLWIPLSFARDAQGIWARDYNKLHGGLFRVERPGKRPLLFSKKDKQPKYFGIEQVYIPQRWHIREIVQDVMRNFTTHYERNKLRGRR